MKAFLVFLFMTIILPVILCLIYKYSDLYTIGPTVLKVLFLDMAVFTVLSGMLLWRYATTVLRKIAIIVFAIIAGQILAIVALNIFHLLTGLFGVQNYHLM